MNDNLKRLRDSSRILNRERYDFWCEGLLKSPASKAFHGNYEGGLIYHCDNIYRLYDGMNRKFNFGLDDDTILITSYFHDVCKIGKYILQKDGSIKINYNMEKGHGTLSVNRINEFFMLDDLEKDIIKFHMGMYGTYEFNVDYVDNGEYSMKELGNAFQHIECKTFYFCDDISAHLYDN